MNKSLEIKLHLNMRKTFFTRRVAEWWNSLTREAVVSFSGDIQNLPGCDPVQCARGDSAWQGSWIG